MPNNDDDDDDSNVSDYTPSCTKMFFAPKIPFPKLGLALRVWLCVILITVIDSLLSALCSLSRVRIRGYHPSAITYGDGPP